MKYSSANLVHLTATAIAGLLLFAGCETIGRQEMTYLGEDTKAPNVVGHASHVDWYGIGVSADAFAKEYNGALSSAFGRAPSGTTSLRSIKAFKEQHSLPQYLSGAALITGSILISSGLITNISAINNARLAGATGSVETPGTALIVFGGILQATAFVLFGVNSYDFYIIGEPFSGELPILPATAAQASEPTISHEKDEEETALGEEDEIKPAASAEVDHEAQQDMVLVKAGSFQMGSDEGDAFEKPVHTVKITKAFFISLHEVTFEQFDAFCQASKKSKKEDSGWGRGDRPVINVGWYEAIEYCNWLSQIEGLTPAYSGSGENIRCDFSASGYRLPTEAEWEYAAKSAGQDLQFKYSGSNRADDVGWYRNNSDRMSHPVGQKMPNRLGLYDMSGNVYEWCWDRDEEYSSESQTDPAGASSGAYRIFRGGGWNYSASDMRSAARITGIPNSGSHYTGFRVVRTGA